MKIKVRLAKPSDSKFMWMVVEKAWLATYPNKKYRITKESIKKQFKIKNSSRTPLVQNEINHTWVAIDDDLVIGICNAQIKQNERYLGATYLLPEYWNKGIGSRLVDKAIRWFGTENEIISDVVSYNQKAYKFYQKHGFKKAGNTRKPKGTELPDGVRIPVFKIVREPKD